jgi:hypothetical protein
LTTIEHSTVGFFERFVKGKRVEEGEEGEGVDEDLR